MKLLKQLVVSAFALCAFAAQAANLSAQDIAEIQQLYAKYNHAIDSGNAEAWADTFTDDGVFSGRFKGREQLMGFIKSWKERGGVTRRHWNSNLSLIGTADGADGAVYLMLWDVGVRPQVVVSTGMYDDKLVKGKDGWRFKSRVVKGDAPPAAPTAPAPTP